MAIKKKVKKVKPTIKIPPIPEKLVPAIIWFATYHTKKCIAVFTFIGIMIWIITTVSFSVDKGKDGKLHVKKVNVERVQINKKGKR